MRNFKELLIWKKGIEISVDIYKLTSTFPASEKFGLISQMTRCAVSIASNIAEGSSRTSDKDYNRFIEIALGSSFELETQVILAYRFNYITIDQLKAFEEMVMPVQKMSFGLYNSLEK